jgi:hypothetical protein
MIVLLHNDQHQPHAPLFVTFLKVALGVVAANLLRLQLDSAANYTIIHFCSVWQAELDKKIKHGQIKDHSGVGQFICSCLMFISPCLMFIIPCLMICLFMFDDHLSNA